MSDNEVILRLTTVALLLGFLGYMHWERVCKRAAFRRQFHRDGEAINLAPLRPRLEEVRRNHTAAAHVHARANQGRADLVARARRKLSHLPFFQNHPAEHEGERHSAYSNSLSR